MVYTLHKGDTVYSYTFRFGRVHTNKWTVVEPEEVNQDDRVAIKLQDETGKMAYASSSRIGVFPSTSNETVYLLEDRIGEVLGHWIKRKLCTEAELRNRIRAIEDDLDSITHYADRKNIIIGGEYETVS